MSNNEIKNTLEYLHDYFITMYHRTENTDEKKGIARCLSKVNELLEK